MTCHGGGLRSPTASILRFFPTTSKCYLSMRQVGGPGYPGSYSRYRRLSKFTFNHYFN